MSSELWAKNEKKRLSQGLNLLHRYVFVTIIPIMVTAIFFAKFLISTLFGSNYSSGTPAFQILLVGVTFYVVAAVNNNLIAGIGKPKTVTAIILSAALFNVLLNLLLIPRFGILGAAFSTSISYLIMLITSTYKATGYIGSKFPIKEWLTLLFPALAFLGMLWLVEKSLHLNTWLEISISALIAGIVYFLLVSILKVVDYREIKHYLKLAR